MRPSLSQPQLRCQRSQSSCLSWNHQRSTTNLRSTSSSPSEISPRCSQSTPLVFPRRICSFLKAVSWHRPISFSAMVVYTYIWSTLALMIFFYEGRDTRLKVRHRPHSLLNCTMQPSREQALQPLAIYRSSTPGRIRRVSFFRLMQATQLHYHQLLDGRWNSHAFWAKAAVCQYGFFFFILHLNGLFRH